MFDGGFVLLSPTSRRDSLEQQLRQGHDAPLDDDGDDDVRDKSWPLRA